MNPWRWVDPRIQEVRVADVEAFFVRRGWRLMPNPNGELLRFEHPSEGNGAAFFQMVPASEETADFRQRITELVTTLSELEECHPVQVLEDILSGDGAERIRENGESVDRTKATTGPVGR